MGSSSGRDLQEWKASARKNDRATLTHQVRDIGLLRDAQCPVYDLDETVRHDADVKRRQTCQPQSRAHRETYGQPFLSLFRLTHEHRVSDLQVVVETEDRVEHAEGGEDI